jgi:hypothetical protein
MRDTRKIQKEPLQPVYVTDGLPDNTHMARIHEYTDPLPQPQMQTLTVSTSVRVCVCLCVCLCSVPVCE